MTSSRLPFQTQEGKMKSWKLCGTFVSMSVLAAFAFICGPTARAADPLVVTTETGLVKGAVDATGLRIFRGIPFAAPPVGNLRWKPPQIPLRWAGIRNATAF